MRNALKVTVAALALVLASSSVAMAGTQLRTRDQLKDDSCVTVAKLQTRDRARDQLKDGSCQTVAKLRTRSHARLRDGSCVS